MSVPEQSKVSGIEFILFKVKTHEILQIGNEYFFSLLNRSVDPDECRPPNFFIEANCIFAFFRLNQLGGIKKEILF